MWSPLKPLILLVALSALAGCGFSPVYGKHSGGTNERLQQVYVERVEGREGQILRTELQDRFNPRGTTSQSKQYQLTVAFNSVVQPVAIEIDRSVSRFTRDLFATIQLVRLQDNKVLLSQSLRRNVSYSVSRQSDFATYVAAQDTLQRGAREMAADIALRVADVLRNEPAAPNPTQ